ncbi:DUF1428 family protein [Microbacterium aurantiacum]|uniref:DUF1428 family protein n=1 Tax=Microbacterium aurantiacum TaxID=162393 RepID=UPI004036CEBB
MTIAEITVVPVPADRRVAYVDFSKRMAAVYRDHGALRVTDYWQSSASPDQADFHAEGTSYETGELRSFADLVGASASESVVVSVTVWPSREARDRGAAAASRDPRVLATMDEDAVFDGARVTGDVFDIALTVPGAD